MDLREAGADDIAAIAALHAASWRDAYASILDPAFLAGPIDADRRDVWSARLSQPHEGQRVIVAVDAGALAGFVCVFADADARWGAHIDNLHVTSTLRGGGLGERLLRAAAAWVVARRPESGLFLYVFESNPAACRFYARLGGVVAERSVSRIPSAHGAPVLRYHWPSAAALAG